MIATVSQLARLISRMICLFALMMPVSLAAASFPAHGNLYVNDDAGVLDAETKARLVARLQKLRTDNGVEMTILTLNGWQGLADPAKVSRISPQHFSTTGGLARPTAMTVSFCWSRPTVTTCASCWVMAMTGAIPTLPLA